MMNNDTTMMKSITPGVAVDMKKATTITTSTAAFKDETSTPLTNSSGSSGSSTKTLRRFNKCQYFMGYDIYFLNEPITFIFTGKVKIIRCKASPGSGRLRLGITDISDEDMQRLAKILEEVKGSAAVFYSTD